MVRFLPQNIQHYKVNKVVKMGHKVGAQVTVYDMNKNLPGVYDNQIQNVGQIFVFIIDLVKYS